MNNSQRQLYFAAVFVLATVGVVLWNNWSQPQPPARDDARDVPAVEFPQGGDATPDEDIRHDEDVRHDTDKPVPTDSIPADEPSSSEELPPHVAKKVQHVLDYVLTHQRPMPGYVGGRTFENRGGNRAQRLPRTDAAGAAIDYREWDVNPHVAGRNRGAQRLITGSDGSAYYTADHYRTFARIR